MPQIHILPDDLIGKIAAGEVVERPASAIKELVENSIDAGAHEISIDIEGGGKKRIVVADDGCGMEPADARLCITRHATSKISTAEDLFNISTMGFRGEALPSIAAVARLTIETKAAPPPIPSPFRQTTGGQARGEGWDGGDLAGFKLVALAGNVIESGDFGCPRGTRICVEDLFFNTPARRKFLKTDKTEEGHVVDVVSRLALAFPMVRFKLRIDGRDNLKCLSVSDHRSRLLTVFGGGVAAEAREFKEEGAGLAIHGFLGDPSAATKIARGIYLFVNRRFVRDRLLNHAVIDSYRNLLPSNSYPFAVIFLEIDPKTVDVNVHPTKQEVRFENSSGVHNFVVDAVRKNLGGNRSTPLMVPGSQLFSGRGEDKGGGEGPPCWLPQREGTEPLPYKITGTESLPYNIVGEPLCGLPSSTFFSSLHVIGQLSGSYILCEGEGGRFVAIDQHAAHERIGFEQLKAQFEKGSVATQQMLIPEQVLLSDKEAGYLSEHLDLLHKLGIDVEPFGNRTFIIKAVPVLLTDTDVKSLIIKLALELSEIGASAAPEELADNILKTIACHRQVRANHRLGAAEMSSLLSQMDEWPNTGRCPHGRPTLIEFGPDEVAKWFKRN